MGIIKVGTEVEYRGSFGRGCPAVVRVESIEACEPGDKNGTPVQAVPFSGKDSCVFDLSDGHWCYGEQIDRIVKEA
jgi:hypothetical protein